MAYPATIDSVPEPTSGAQTLAAGAHALMHQTIKDVVEALETKVGIDNSADTTSIDYKIRRPIRLPHTWAWDGSASINTLPGFYVSLAPGQVAKLASARHAVGAGTATATIRINGVAATGFNGMSLTTTATTTNPTDITLADGDYVDLDVTAASGASELRVTAFVDYSLS